MLTQTICFTDPLLGEALLQKHPIFMPPPDKCSKIIVTKLNLPARPDTGIIDKLEKALAIYIKIHERECIQLNSQK